MKIIETILTVIAVLCFTVALLPVVCIIFTATILFRVTKTI